MADAFWERYKHPKWQEKRLRIMERDGFECRHCGDDQKTLNVHHGYYERGLDPWDYPDESLWTLCDPCHKELQSTLLGIRQEISRFEPEHIQDLLRLIQLLRAQYDCKAEATTDRVINAVFGVTQHDDWIGISYDFKAGHGKPATAEA